MLLQPQPELITLAPELIENVTRQVTDRRDLSNMRKACKTLDKPAAKELFKFIYISPAEKDVSTWHSISQHDVIRHIPRHAVIRTQSDVEDRGLYGGGREREEISEDFEKAVAALSRFPNLDSVELGFTPECRGRVLEYWEEDPAENASQREDMLRLIFQAIKDRAADEKNRTIRKLTITNLQNCPIPDFTSSKLFRDVMGQLDELHIALTQEYNDHGPDRDYTKVELQTFPAHLCSAWLKPISSNLKALSIYNRDENWGPFPGYFQPSGIGFPKLETLALGYYTLAHDNDIDWILATKSLRKLILHNCMIACRIRIDNTNMAEWKVRTHDWTPMPDRAGGGWCASFKYEGKWSSCLNRIAAGLPNLVDFRFDQGDPYNDPPYDVNHRDACGLRIFPRRYIVFDNGILPTHWPEAEDDGELHTWLEDEDGFPNLHEENLEEDQKSLDRLLEKLKTRN